MTIAMWYIDKERKEKHPRGCLDLSLEKKIHITILKLRVGDKKIYFLSNKSNFTLINGLIFVQQINLREVRYSADNDEERHKPRGGCTVYCVLAWFTVHCTQLLVLWCHLSCWSDTWLQTTKLFSKAIRKLL